MTGESDGLETPNPVQPRRQPVLRKAVGFPFRNSWGHYVISGLIPALSHLTQPYRDQLAAPAVDRPARVQTKKSMWLGLSSSCHTYNLKQRVRHASTWPSRRSPSCGEG